MRSAARENHLRPAHGADLTVITTTMGLLLGPTYTISDWRIGQWSMVNIRYSRLGF
jgi:hypothetical protein